jgi:hypothetical protein
MDGRSPRHFPRFRVHVRWLDRICLLFRYVKFTVLCMALPVMFPDLESLSIVGRKSLATEESEMAGK